MDSIVGIKLDQWLRLLKENHFRVHPRYWFKICAITLMSVQNWRWSHRETAKYKEKILNTSLDFPSIFVLGHWRSGTTFLHNLLSRDPQFAFPTLFDTFYPDPFLIREKTYFKRIKPVGPKERPMDNVKITYHSPGEEEFALAIMCLCSPLLGWMFPRNEAFYDRYLTFEDVPPEKVNEWKRSFQFYARKLTLKYQRPLIMKSPPHTARIRLLREIFPQAKFIHIHRNPYHVFLSTKNLFRKGITKANLQMWSENSIDTTIISKYKVMYKHFFDDVETLAENQYIDIAFERLESSPLEVLEDIYKKLELPGFDKNQASFNRYIHSMQNYRKNVYDALDEGIKAQIGREWDDNFKIWGYNKS